jgi:hypothetical protein
MVIPSLSGTPAMLVFLVDHTRFSRSNTSSTLKFLYDSREQSNTLA